MRYLLALYLFFGYSILSGGVHPKIPDPKKSNCKVCHSNVLGEKNHLPVEEGCFSCHNFEFREEKLFVNLNSPVPELCYQCHDNYKKVKEYKSLHMVFEECSNCHLSHSSKNDWLLLEKLPELCFQCHDVKELKEKKHKNQPVNGTNCISCHNPHFSNNKKLLKGKVFHLPFSEGDCESCHAKTLTRKVRLKAPIPSLCIACHSDLEQEFKENFKHFPFKENKCLDCHNPHLSEEGKLLIKKEKDLCLECHKNILSGAEKHPPAEESCLDCHKPHSSKNLFLISEKIIKDGKISSLCFNCHNPSKELEKKHRMAKLENLNCLRCHNPHSSKDKKFLNDRSLHPVFDDCSNCHLEGAKTSEKEPDLCINCHPEIREKATSFKYKHPPVEESCTQCHNPHISNYPPLLIQPTNFLCKDCHNLNFEFEHGIIRMEGCSICHFSHGSDKKYHLKLEGNELCLSCHLFGKESDEEKKMGIRFPKIKLNNDMLRGHPSLNHPVSGKFKLEKIKDIELSCLSCHSPHGGKAKNLYTFGARTQTELCVNCHDK